MSVFSIITRFLSFIYKIFLSRTLTTYELGIYTIALSIFAVFATIISSGMPLGISKLSSQITTKKYSNNYATAGFVFSFIISIILCLLVIVSQPIFNLIFANEKTYYIILCMSPAIISTGAYCSMRGSLWGKEKYIEASLVELIEQILRIIICIVIFIVCENIEKTYSPAIAFGIAGVISTIIGFIYYFKVGGKFSNPNKYFKPVISSSLPITLSRLAGSLIFPLISIILPLQLITLGYTNSTAISLLGIILGMTFPLLSIPSTLIGSLGMALIPKIADFSSSKNYNFLNKQINQSIKICSIICFVFIPIFIALGEPICLFLFNNIEAGYYLKIGSILIVPMGLTQLTTSIINSMGKETKALTNFAICGVILTICIILLPYILGIYSIFIALLINNILCFILNIITIKKYASATISYLKDTFYLSLITIFSSLLTYLLYCIISKIFTQFFSICICGAICLITFCLGLIIFNLISINLIKKYLVKFKRLKKV